MIGSPTPACAVPEDMVQCGGLRRSYQLFDGSESRWRGREGYFRRSHCADAVQTFPLPLKLPYAQTLVKCGMRNVEDLARTSDASAYLYIQRGRSFS